MLVLAFAAAAVAASPAGARPMLVGVHDDSAKWTADTSRVAEVQRQAGFGTVKVSFPWRRGMWHPGRTERDYIYRLSRMSLLQQRVVLAFTGRARQAPRTAATRQQFCSYVREVVASVPAVRDVVIWNEVNSPSFWRPQRNAPREYAALLARCWDLLHAQRPDVNVILSTASAHKPLRFLRALGAAYRASGRTRPLVDTFGHNPYPRYASERPSAVHRDGYVGQGDYPALVSTIRASFAATPQALTSIWYLEDGFQTHTPFGWPLYSGRENARSLVPVHSQAEQVGDALALAYCRQPLVGAFFNFQLADERRLAGWQSGVLWANWQPKPAYGPVRDTAEAIAGGDIECW
jgi:hypothetical protein